MNSSDKNNNSENITIQEEFSFKDFFKICLNNWIWIVACLVCAVGIALFWIYRQQPVYERYEQVLVTDQDSNNGIGEVGKSFSAMTLFSKNTNVNNELISIKSPAILYEVADTLHLDMNYSVRDGLRKKTLYGATLPMIVQMLDVDKQGNGSFRFIIEQDGSLSLKKFKKTLNDGKQIKFKEELTIPAGQNEAQTPLGRIRIVKNPDYMGLPVTEPMEITVTKLPMQVTVELYDTKLLGDLVDPDADVIQLSIRDVSVQRAVDILNWVLNVYNQNWVDDKNRMAVATSAFIEDRLRVIEEELGDVDVNIASYMSKTGTLDVTASTGVILEKGAKIDEEVIALQNQLAVANFMKEFIQNNKNNNNLLPVNLGIESRELGEQVILYNDYLIQRNTIASNSSDKNPLVINYDQHLVEMRGAILNSVENEIANLKTTIASMEKEQRRVDAKMSGTPMESLPLLAEERQQKVKEELYLFLLEKREENQLSQKFSADNTRVITPPIGSLSPVSPRKNLILIISIILGLGIPILLLYFLEATNTKVRGKNDLDNVKIPFAGEIPHVGKKKKLKIDTSKLGKQSKDEKPPLAVVEEGKRDVVNEAFRVIRSNIDFMAGKNAGSQVIMLTSFNPGSGKSFITYNLALSFAIKGKKVLIIDCDLRHGSSSMYVGMPHKGLTNYLTGNVDDWKSLVKNLPGNPNLSILPIGKMPPNPAELLEEPRFQEVVEEARKEYDIIFLDCPPVNIVVDTQIVGQYADRTLFVVRAGLLERSALKELNEFYDEKKFKNMSVILNGTEAIHSRYYTYGNYQNLQ